MLTTCVAQGIPTVLLEPGKTSYAPKASALAIFLMEEEPLMLIVNDEQRLQAGVCNMNDRCQYCSKALAAYPLIMSDDPEQTVYHAACAVQLAAEIMVDLYTFFSPPPIYDRLFVLCASVDRKYGAAS